MLKKYGVFFCLFFLTLTLSSCFEVIEEVTLHKDGTGEMSLTINLSQSKSKVASILLMDKVNGYKVPNRDEIQKEINDAVIYLKKQPGISNVKSTSDFTNYIATVTFSFKDVANINNITRNILQQNKVKATNVSTYSYNKAAGTFARTYQYLAETRTEYNKLKKEDRQIFQTASYTSIYHFDNPVISDSNPTAKKSKSGKAIMQRTSVPDIINGTANLTHQIQLSK